MGGKPKKKYGGKSGHAQNKKYRKKKYGEKSTGENLGMHITYFRKKSKGNRKKGRETQTSGCACAHPREHLRGHVTFGHVTS